MKKETESQLDNLMGKYERRSEESRKKKEQIKSEEETFLSEFKRLRKEVIRPVMEDIGNHLKARKHDYRIYEEEESVDSSGRTRDASITVHIFPAGVDLSKYGLLSPPSISFFAARYKRKVWIHGNNIIPGRGGSAGPRGEFRTEEITSEVVGREILGVLQEIFDPRW